MKLEKLYFDTSTELLVCLDAENKIENANKAFLDLIGNTKDNIIGSGILSFIAPNEATEAEKFLTKARIGEKQVFHWTTDANTSKVVRFKMSLKSDDGIILKAEDPGALNNKWGKKIVNEQILQLLFNLVPYPLFVKNSQSEYVLLNQAQADLFGLSMAEMIGKSDEAFIKDAKELELVQKSDKEVLDSFQKTILPDQKITTPDGKMYILETNKLPFTNDVSGETNILGVSIDNTERKLAEAKLKAA